MLNIRKHVFPVIFLQLCLPPSSGSGCQDSLGHFICLISIELSRETSEELSQLQKYQNTEGQILQMNLSGIPCNNQPSVTTCNRLIPEIETVGVRVPAETRQAERCGVAAMNNHGPT